MSETKNVVNINEDRSIINQIMLDPNTSKSYKIRKLNSLGLNRSQILKEMKVLYPNFLYQHVRNVLVTQLKKPIE